MVWSTIDGGQSGHLDWKSILYPYKHHVFRSCSSVPSVQISCRREWKCSLRNTCDAGEIDADQEGERGGDVRDDLVVDRLTQTLDVDGVHGACHELVLVQVKRSQVFCCDKQIGERLALATVASTVPKISPFLTMKLIKKWDQYARAHIML